MHSTAFALLLDVGVLASVELTTGHWQTIAAVVTAGAALWQFAGLKEHRRAGELLQLEQATASAEARNDPVSHAYRAQTLRRLQAHEAAYSNAGPNALWWAGMALLSFIFMIMARDAESTPQLVAFAIFVGSVFLAGRAFSRWMYSSRTLQRDMSETLEATMIVHKQKFIDTRKKDTTPVQSYDEVLKEARANVKKAFQRQRNTILMFAVLVAFTLVSAWWLEGQVRTRQIKLNDVREWAMVAGTVVVIVLPTGFLRRRPLLAKLIPRRSLRVGFCIAAFLAWSLLCALYLPSTLGSGWTWLRSQESSPSLQSELQTLSALIAVAVFLVVMFGLALSRDLRAWWRKRMQVEAA